MKLHLILAALTTTMLASCGNTDADSKRQTIEEQELRSKLVTDGQEVVLVPAKEDLPANFESLDQQAQEQVLVELANQLEVQDSGFSLVAGCSSYRCFAAGPYAAGAIGPNGAAAIGVNGAAGISFITGNYCYKPRGGAAVCGNAYY